jgi:hypothetical protein
MRRSERGLSIQREMLCRVVWCNSSKEIKSSPGGTRIACFRPALVTNARKGDTSAFVFPDSHTASTIRRA